MRQSSLPQFKETVQYYNPRKYSGKSFIFKVALKKSTTFATKFECQYER